MTVDSVAPQITISATAAVTAGKSLQVTASSSEGGILAVDVDLNRDGAYSGSELSYKSLSSGSTITLSQVTLEGTYKIRARQTDVAGNMGAAEQSSVVDPYAGFVGDSQLKAMVQPVMRELGYTAKWDGKAVSVPAGYRPSDAKLAEPVLISTRATTSKQFDALKSELVNLGMTINATNAQNQVIEGSLPLYKAIYLPKLTGFSTASYINSPITMVGAAQNDGVPVMRIPQFQQLTGAIGTGITVGVISDSASQVGAGVAGSIASGDLPANTTILLDGPSGSTDEGRAMMEIVYDAAPGSALAFSTGQGGPQVFANSITNLANFGCDVITDDLRYLNQPIFNDGIINQSVDTAYARGITYTAAAGNQGELGWRSNWLASSGSIGTGANIVTGTFMNFGNNDILQNLTLPSNYNIRLTFQWDAAYLEGGSNLAN
ncbi:MAG: hypothetical protein ACOYNP_18475, partial [Gemmataceae bacterium]